MKSEIISLNIGQAGVQIGTAFLELFLLEHCIDPDGFSTFFGDNDDLTFESFFEKVENNRFVPRAIFLDSEPNVIDEIRSGVYHNLFHPDQLLSGIMDGANNFARGCFTLSGKLMDAMEDKIRKSVEVCELPQGFFINHSLSGGTGSGLTSVLLLNLSTEYSKYPRIQMPIFPGQSLASAITEPYNCTFHVHSTMSISNMSLLFDNESLYEICRKNLFMQSPNFTNINRIIALINSSITASLRFEGVMNSNLANILTNLIPFPRIHFPIVSHAPIMHASSATHVTMTTKLMLQNIFSQDYQLMKCNQNQGQYIAILLNGRGLISPMELNESVLRLKLTNTIDFVEWSPRGFKICLNNQTPTIIPDSEIAFSERALTMICNSTSIRNCWIPLGKRFDLLFERRAFIHWFIEEGMEETEFLEAREDLSTLCSDYLIITQSFAENMMDVPVKKISSKRPSRKSTFQ